MAKPFVVGCPSSTYVLLVGFALSVQMHQAAREWPAARTRSPEESLEWALTTTLGRDRLLAVGAGALLLSWALLRDAGFVDGPPMFGYEIWARPSAPTDRDPPQLPGRGHGDGS